jgi:alcohol dehydrogenase class IV
MRFEFATANRVVFGPGLVGEAGAIVRGFGRRPLVVTGSHPERARPLLTLLEESELQAVAFIVAGEPTVEMVRSATILARKERCDCVVGFGGGATIDAAKAAAILATNPGDVLDYLEIIGRGQKLTKAPLPLLAVPTTAGSGAEVTRNSVIASPSHRVKVSLRNALMLPRVALVDPELTSSLPAAVTATTGLDALSQVIEPLVSSRANPLTDGLCREGISRVARSLRKASADGRDASAREDMAVASLFGGLALANAGLGAVHGLAGPLGGMIEAPHGAICAALLPHVVAANVAALRRRQPSAEALRRYQQVAVLLTGAADATADDAVVWLAELVADLAIPGLRNYGLDSTLCDELTEKAARASSMKGNPIELSREELASIIEASL